MRFESLGNSSSMALSNSGIARTVFKTGIVPIHLGTAVPRKVESKMTDLLRGYTW